MHFFIKNNTNTRFQMKRVGFLSGFMYFFGLADNPYTEVINQIKKRSDIEALKSDFKVVGGDFQRVISKNKFELNACK